MNFRIKIQKIMKNKSLIIKSLFVVLSFVAFSSCGKSNEKPASTANEDTFHLTDTASTVYENPKIKEFKAFIALLDSADAASVTKATEKYKLLFAGESTLLCDSGFVVFQALYDSLEFNLSNAHQADTTNYEPLLLADQTVVPQKLKEYRNKLKFNGFKISSSEGVTYIEQDRIFLVRNFYSFVTPVMKDYLTELQKENKEGFANEGEITISPRQLVDRNVWYEKFVYENPNFVFAKNCKDYQKAYLTYLLCGYEDTKVYVNEETKELSDFYLNAYNYLIAKYPSSKTAQTITPYYEALKQKQTSTAQSILKNYHIKGLIYGTN
jgi:hypothetical protein